MEQSPSLEVNSRSDIWEIFHLLWNLKVYYRIHKVIIIIIIYYYPSVCHTRQAQRSQTTFKRHIHS
jgi:hypothetical protein